MRLVGLTALLPLLVVAVAGFGYDRFRCAFSGEITDMACCPHDEAPDAPAVPVANAASCCDHEVATVVRAPAEVPGVRIVVLAAPVALPRTLAAPLLEGPRAPVRRAEGAE